MGKRKHGDKEEDLEVVLKKLKRLTKKVDQLRGGKTKEANNDGNRNAGKPPTDNENNPPNGQHEDVDGRKKDDKGNETDAGSSSDDERKSEDNGVNPDDDVDEEWAQLMGDDPTESQALKMSIKPDLLKRWAFFCNEGIKKDDFESLMEKYACIKEFNAPTLNPQIAVTMKESAIARDNHMVEIQKMAGTALSMTGYLMTSMYENRNQGLDLEDFLAHQIDMAKILTQIIYKQSASRKAFIEPGLTKETKTILKGTKIDEFLYGKELSEKIKEAKALEKTGENLKIQQAAKSTPAKQNLNYKPPFAGRPPTGQMGYTPFGGRQKPRVFFKNKQQFVNHRAQTQPQPRQRPYFNKKQ